MRREGDGRRRLVRAAAQMPPQEEEKQEDRRQGGQRGEKGRSCRAAGHASATVRAPRRRYADGPLAPGTPDEHLGQLRTKAATGANGRKGSEDWARRRGARTAAEKRSPSRRSATAQSHRGEGVYLKSSMRREGGRLSARRGRGPIGRARSAKQRGQALRSLGIAGERGGDAGDPGVRRGRLTRAVAGGSPPGARAGCAACSAVGSAGVVRAGRKRRPSRTTPGSATRPNRPTRRPGHRRCACR